MDPGISGFGTTLTGQVTGLIGNITKISISGSDVTDIDITTMTNNANRWRKFIAGMKDARELRIDIVYDPDQMATIMAAFGGEVEDWTIAFPDGSTLVCDGYLKALSTEIPMDDKISQVLGIRLSDRPIFVSGDSGESEA